MGGGFVYVQNARPDGPVAYLFHRATEVPLRWVAVAMGWVAVAAWAMAVSVCRMCDWMALSPTCQVGGYEV